MLNLLRQASEALSTGDADRLERLASEADEAARTFQGNACELERLRDILRQQAEAALAYLMMRRRLSETSSIHTHPWVR